MAAIITSTSTQFTLEHQNWWPSGLDGSHGEKHLYPGERPGGHGDVSHGNRTKHKHGNKDTPHHQVIILFCLLHL